ncbi:Sodium- and chloride-dependent glycine transporter 2-like protein [Aphelenchoides besseyi]|nr:Sodium- and chloride-dependent glycine transporter 2-like protein [Aphelenchoides besseyi]
MTTSTSKLLKHLRSNSRSGPSTESALEDSANEDIRLYGCFPPSRTFGLNDDDTVVLNSRHKIRRSRDAKLTNQLGHFLLTVSYVLHTSSLLEFPIMCFKHAGITFFVPYLIVLLFVGTPMLIAELAVGQFSSMPLMTLFKALNTTYSGLGKLMLIVALWRMFTTSALFVQSIHLTAISLFATFSRQHSWSKCVEGRSSQMCVDYNFLNSTEFSTAIQYNDALPTVRLTPPFLDYLKTQIYLQAFRIDQIQWSVYGLYLTTALAWLLIGGLTAVGIRRIGGLMVTSKLFGLILLLLCAAAVFSSSSASDGLVFFFDFDYRHLTDGSAWLDATKHVLLSLSLIDGTIHKMGTLRGFQSSLFFTVFGLLVVSFLFSLFGALFFFASLSSITYVLFSQSKQNRIQRMAEYLGHGKLVSLSVFPELINSRHLHQSSLFIGVFYLSIALITLPNAIIHRSKVVEAAQFSVWYSRLFRCWHNRPAPAKLIVGIVVALAIVPVVFLLVHSWTQISIALIENVITSVIIIGALIECLIIGYSYDISRFNVDLQTMNGPFSHWFSRLLSVCFCVLIPFLLLMSFIFDVSFDKIIRFDNYVASNLLIRINWAFFTTIIGAPLISALVYFCVWYSHDNAIRVLCNLSSRWKPESPKAVQLVGRGRRTFGVEPNNLKTKMYDNHDPFDLVFYSGRHKSD